MTGKIAALAAMIFLLALPAAGEQGRVPDYPAFIFGHIVWEDESTTQSIRELVKNYQQRQIPVSGVIIDSPWETAYNTFEFDTNRFPEHKQLLAELKSQNIAVILWITSAVNTDDPGYEDALKQKFFVPGFEKYKWWKGTGGLIDFTNPQALAFWHQRMDKALDLGIDGWKCDGVEGAMAVRGISRQREYSKNYYSDFFNYSREHTRRPIVVMARGIEEFNEHSMGLPHFLNPLGLGPNIVFAPREVSFMSWMGDQTPNWDGLRDAWHDLSLSAQAGYLIPGFDIAGYRQGDPGKELFTRWAQFGAFVPLMENGGAGQHLPWYYGDDTLELYRKLAVWHEELGWYFYSLVPEKFSSGRSLVAPLGKTYLLGDDILVAPILKKGGKVSARIPKGKWRYWFNLEQVYKQGETVPAKFPLAEYPVYLREGSLIPLWVKSPFGGHQLNSSFVSQDTFWLLPGSGQGKRQIYYQDGAWATLSWQRDAKSARVSAEGLERGAVLLLEGVGREPRSIFSIRQLAVTGKDSLVKVDCDKLKPGAFANYCLRGDQLFLEMIPGKGRVDIQIEF